MQTVWTQFRLLHVGAVLLHVRAVWSEYTLFACIQKIVFKMFARRCSRQYEQTAFLGVGFCGSYCPFYFSCNILFIQLKKKLISKLPNQKVLIYLYVFDGKNVLHLSQSTVKTSQSCLKVKCANFALVTSKWCKFQHDTIFLVLLVRHWPVSGHHWQVRVLLIYICSIVNLLIVKGFQIKEIHIFDLYIEKKHLTEIPGIEWCT